MVCDFEFRGNQSREIIETYFPLDFLLPFITCKVESPKTTDAL